MTPTEFPKSTQSYRRQDSRKIWKRHHLGARCPGIHRTATSNPKNRRTLKMKSINGERNIHIWRITQEDSRPCRMLSSLLLKIDLHPQNIWACILLQRLACGQTSRNFSAILAIFLPEFYIWRCLETKITPKSTSSNSAQFSWTSSLTLKTDEIEPSLICLIWKGKERLTYLPYCSYSTTSIEIHYLGKRFSDSSENINKRTCCCLMDTGGRLLSISRLTISWFLMQYLSMSSSIESLVSMFQPNQRQERHWQERPLWDWVAKHQLQMLSLQTAKRQLRLQREVPSK